MHIKKSEVVAVFGSDQSIAKAFGISRQAVHRWGEYIPENKAYKFRDMKKKIKADQESIAA